jgi:hypothetical protein
MKQRGLGKPWEALKLATQAEAAKEDPIVLLQVTNLLLGRLVRLARTIVGLLIAITGTLVIYCLSHW